MTIIRHLCELNDATNTASGRWQLPTEASGNMPRAARMLTYIRGAMIRRQGTIKLQHEHCRHDAVVHTAGCELVGALDLAGNVWNGSTTVRSYPASAQTDPTGSASGDYRVLRGGSWTLVETTCVRLAAATTPRPS